VGTGEVGAMDRGTWVRIQVRIDAAARRVDEAVFKVVGSDAAMASASLVTDRLHGASIDQAREMQGLMIVAELQLPIEQAHEAGLAVEAALKALDDWERKARARAQAGSGPGR
jgi:NifU-like protein involved in Fe-S cluster formation